MQTEKEVEDALELYAAIHHELRYNCEPSVSIVRMAVIAVLYWMLKKNIRYEDGSEDKTLDENPIAQDIVVFKKYLEKTREKRGPDPGTPGTVQEG